MKNAQPPLSGSLIGHKAHQYRCVLCSFRIYSEIALLIPRCSVQSGAICPHVIIKQTSAEQQFNTVI
jgi:hypothetical protein